MLLFFPILLIVKLQEVIGSGTVTFEITGYSAVGQQREDDGTSCDGSFVPCEVFFEICAEADGSGLCDKIYSEVFRTEQILITQLPGLVYPTNSLSQFELELKLFDLDLVLTSMRLSSSDFLGEVTNTFNVVIGDLEGTIGTSNQFHDVSFKITGRCDPEYYGAACTVFCSSADDILSGHFTCDVGGNPVCLQGFTDPSTNPPCTNTINQCLPDPCQNGGSCSQNTGEITFSCDCSRGFTEELCNVDVDECSPNPCVNGGVCQQGPPPTFSCTCDPTFGGSRCESTVDVCQLAANACSNGGSCSIVSPGVTTCVCAPGYEGASCQVNSDECATNPCQNGGACTQSSPTGFMCTCLPGSTGTTCGEFLDPCTSVPCKNDATCVPGSFTDFTCLCRPGFSGAACEKDVDACVSGPCQNGGKCTDTVTGFVCCCSEGFTGDNCAGIREVINLTEFLRDFTFIPEWYFRIILSYRCPQLTFISQNEILIQSNADRNCFYGSFYDKARAAGRDIEHSDEHKTGLNRINQDDRLRDADNVTSSILFQHS